MLFKNLFHRKNKNDNSFHVGCYNTNLTEVDQCKTGDELNIWYPKQKGSSEVRFYRPGAEYEDGPVGMISGYKGNRIRLLLRQGNQLDATIEKIIKGKLLIKINTTKN